MPKHSSLSQSLLFCALASFPAAAQTTPTPTSTPSERPAEASHASAPTGTSQLSSFAPPADLTGNAALFHWGPIQLRPQITYRVSYGDGLLSQPGQESKTVIQEVIPSFLFQLGDKWTFSYTPAFRFYSDDDFEDSIDHSFSLNGGTSYHDWSFGFSQGYSFSSTPLVETGAQTDQEAYSTHFSAGHQFSESMSIDLGVSQDLRFVEDQSQPQNQNQDLGNSKEWSTMDWLNYHFWPGLTAGLGGGFGYVQVGTDMIYEQLQARVNWQLGEKLSLLVSGGFDARQFLDSDEPSLLNPIYNASIQYQLFEQTSLSLSAGRSVNRSYFEDQITENTSVDLGLSQRLLGWLYFSASAGFGTTDYKGTTTSADTARDDESTHYSVGLSMPVLKRGSASVFYSGTRNRSDESDFSYSSSQMGLELSYQF